LGAPPAKDPFRSTGPGYAAGR
ncbi:MAG: hypothetical protein QOE40_2970, partial [Actinomycetota bacterium]|nr:hypothetical protein [Actinomycetota bacterium]